MWRAVGGAWEKQVLGAVDTMKVADLALAAPNGNRIEKQEMDNSIPRWIRSTAAEGASSLSRFARAAVFVGHAALAPGVRKPEVYVELSGLFCADLENAGISVVRGEEHRPQLLPDGMHWTASSGGVVQDILADMVKNAREVIVSARDVQSPKWWQWVRDNANGIHYATCKSCAKGLTAGHVASRKHRLLCEFTELPPVLEHLWPLGTPAIVEQGSEPHPVLRAVEVQNNVSSIELEPTPPPQQEEPQPPPPPRPQEVSRHRVSHDWDAVSLGASFTTEYMSIVAGEEFIFTGEFDQGWAKGYSPRLAYYGWVPGNRLAPEIEARALPSVSPA